MPVLATFAESDQVGLTILPPAGGTTLPYPGSYYYDFGTNVTLEATPNIGQLFLHWIIDGETVAQNPVTLSMTKDHTVQPVFTQNQTRSGNGNERFNLNVPPVLILAFGILVIALCFIGYLAPIGMAYIKKKTPRSIIKARLVLGLICIAIIVGPIGTALVLYRDNLYGIFTPSNIDEAKNLFSGQGGFGMPQVMGAWFDLSSRTIGVTLNFTNPTHTDLTIVACSGYLADHMDNYSLGQIALINPVVAAPGETITFQMTCPLTAQTLDHLQASHSNSSSLDVDVFDQFINYAGIMLHINGTMTVHIESI